jgi:hypothetical protein
VVASIDASDCSASGTASFISLRIERKMNIHEAFCEGYMKQKASVTK